MFRVASKLLGCVSVAPGPLEVHLGWRLPDEEPRFASWKGFPTGPIRTSQTAGLELKHLRLLNPVDDDFPALSSRGEAYFFLRFCPGTPILPFSS